MPLSDDPWIAKHSIIDAERLHAIGLIEFSWNHCERNHLRIFCDLLDLDDRKGWIIGYDMGDVSISERISEALQLSKFDEEARRVISHYIKAYDKCRLNRNALTHFTATSKSPSFDDATAVVLLRTKGIKGHTIEIPSSLPDLRRVAEEIYIFVVYSWKLHDALLAIRQGLPGTLPPAIAEPELLVKSPPQTHPKPTRPPKPSRGACKRKHDS